MSTVAVRKASKDEKCTLPVFAELAKTLDLIRNRAFERFEKRGGECGHELEDWLDAEREIQKSPTGELVDNGKAYEVQIALPGYDVKEVEVTATSEEIVVHAASRREKKSESGKVLWSEFASSDVYRWIPTPGAINVAATVATLDKGLLCITAPKAVAPEKRLAAVKAA